LRARRVHEQHVALEANRRHALERLADGGAPGEFDFARRLRQRSHQLDERFGNDVTQAAHLYQKILSSRVMHLVLASASPRRAELLRAAGFTFDTIPAHVDESRLDGEQPSTYVRRLAAEKSSRVQAALAVHRRDAVVLGADTTVVMDETILGKPIDDADAALMLERLAGRRHDVLTGISLRRGAFEIGRVETTAVYFENLTAAEIAWYVASGEGRDKAGGYAIQGLAARFVLRIEGSYANVVGLPIAAVHALLKELS
jgi:septum formation protein